MAENNQYSGFALTVNGVGYKDNQEVNETFRFNDIVKFNLNSENKPYIGVTLLSITVDKNIGCHNSIEVSLQITEYSNASDKVKEAVSFSLTELQNLFVNKEVKLTVEKEDVESFKVAEKYYVYNAKPRFGTGKKSCKLNLKIYSWDLLLDIDKYSRSYTGKRLGEDILKTMAENHNHGDDVMINMNILKHEYEEEDATTKKREKKILELKQPFLVQYNETEYGFMLRNANRCGEFLFFESGKLNLGLTIYTPAAEVDVTGYTLLESLNDCTPETSSTNFYHNTISSKGSSSKPFVGECGNEDYYETFGESTYDSKQGWMDLNPPHWSRALAALFKYSNLVNYVMDFGLSELALQKSTQQSAQSGLDKIKESYFGKAEDDYKKSWNYAHDSKGNEYRHAQFAEYYKDSENRKAGMGEIPMEKRMDSDAFFEMRKLEEQCAKEQYKIVFDSCQKEIMLGSVLTINDISSGCKFLVVGIKQKSEKSDNDTVNSMEVTVVPYTGAKFRGVTMCVPLLAKVDPVRVVGPQTAKVTENRDPERLNRVRVRFSWESKGDDTPWISVTTPWATSEGSGVSYMLNEGDEVVVDFEYGNVERPFVVGSRYTRKNIPPYGQRKFSTILRSKNGHYIGFHDSTFGGNILTSMIPGLNFFRFIGSANAAFAMVTEDKDKLRALGGIEISDYYGLYTIRTSSDQRAINIESPFGTVNMSAAMGINITAPNGNVRIVGKNVDIVAGNNLTLKSGTNIDTTLMTMVSSGNFKNLAKSVGQSLADKVTGLFDVPALRFAIELLFRPIAGTLKIHSGRYLILEGGGSTAPLPASPHLIDAPKAGVLNSKGKDAQAQIYQLTKDIKKAISKFTAYKQAYRDAYSSVCAKRAALKAFMDRLPSKKANFDVDANINQWIGQQGNLTKENITTTIFDDGYLNDLKARPILKSQFDNNVDRIVTEINQIRKLKAEVEKSDWNPGIMAKDDPVYKEAKKIIKNPRDEHFGQFNTSDANLDAILFIDLGRQNLFLREVVMELLDTNTQTSLFTINRKIDNFGTDSDDRWNNMIKAIVPRKENDTISSWIKGEGMAIFNHIVPVDTLNAYCWDSEKRGEILFSTKAGAVYSIDGDTIGRRYSASLQDVKDAMKLATIE